MIKFKSLFISLMLILAVTSSGDVFASGWADYYNGYLDFPRVWGHQGDACFIDKTSVNVERYDPPYYIISINVFWAQNQGYGMAETPHPMRFYYNYDKTEMYVAKDDYPDDWNYIEPNGSVMAGWMEAKSVGEAAFYLAYRLKFYGAYKWKNTVARNGEYQVVFGDGFYRRLQ